MAQYFIVNTTAKGDDKDPAKIFATSQKAEGYKIFYGKENAVVCFIDKDENILDVDIDTNKYKCIAKSENNMKTIANKDLTGNGFDVLSMKRKTITGIGESIG